MSKNVMGSEDLIENIKKAVHKNNASLKVRQLLFGNEKVSRNQPVESEFISHLVKFMLWTDNNEELVQVLVEFLESEAENDLGMKKLIAAVLQGNLESAEYFLKNNTVKLENYGRDWNNDYALLPALHSAVLYRETNTRTDMLKLLIEHGLNIHITNPYGKNLYHFLSGKNAAEVAKILYESGLTEIDRDSNGLISPLRYAIMIENFDLVKFLIDKGADVKRSGNSVRHFPLTDAFERASYDNFDIVDVLMANGADINARDKEQGWSVLHYACYNHYRDPRVIECLLKKGADVNVEDNIGETPTFKLHSDLNDSCLKCLIAIIKALANSTVVSKKNMDYIESHPTARNLFKKYSEEVSLLKSLVFYAPHSYHSVLKISIKSTKLAKLTRNEEFVAAFRNNLNSLTLYREDLIWIMKDAIRIRDESIKIDVYLKSAFGDFFPDVVLDKVAENLSVRDVKFE